MKSMKAVVYTLGKGLNFIQDRNQPVVRGHVVIQGCTAAINPVDSCIFMHNRGVGLDVAGIVTEVGEDVKKYR